MKAVALFYGNCQSAALQFALSHYPDFAERFEVRYMSSFRHPTQPDRELSDDDAVRCRLVFEQTHSHIGLPAELRERLTDLALTIRFPPLDTTLFWPFNVRDPRNVSEEALPFGRYPYGDRIVVALMKEGMRGEAVWDAYLEHSAAKMPNLDRLWQAEKERLASREIATDIKIYSILRETLFSHHGFGTINHPKGWLLGKLWGAMVEQARVGLELPQPTLGITDQLFKRWDPLGAYEVPIHPEVAKHFALKWWTPDHKYRTGAGMQTWEEYMRHYIDWR